VAEGIELVRTALSSGAAVESVYVGAEGRNVLEVGEIIENAAHSGARVFDLAPGVLERVADTVTPQPMMAVLPMTDVALETLRGGRLVVVCAEVRDPGNAGTVLRSADASGADAVVFCAGSVDPYNPKTVRSSAGSVFHVPLVVAEHCVETLRAIKALGFRRLGAAAHGGADYTTMDWTAATALVVGNESGGLPGPLATELDALVGIPMAGRAESLNVGVACAVLCFEALRQRRDQLRR
jgi:RNA methyltransferase, TrmH family